MLRPSRIYWGSLVSVALAWLVMLSGCSQSSPTTGAKKPPQKPAASQPETKPAEPEATKPAASPPAADEGAVKPAVAGAETQVATIPAVATKAPPVPLGLPPLSIPEDNPMTPEKIELGKMLYFDTRLSGDGTVSCATCHDPKAGWTERRATSEGIGKQRGGRNSPSVINAAYATSQFWDGRAKTLEEQALGPIENPIEMGHKLPSMIADLSKVGVYQEQFKKVFGSEVTAENLAKAIAAFERTVLSGNSPYDVYEAGDKNALNESQKKGRELFENAGCTACHAPPLFSNYRFFNAGVGMNKEKPDPGRKDVTKDDADMGKFRVPALRSVADTGPYFHDGSVEKLEDAVALMAAGGLDNPNRSILFNSIRERKLTAEEQKHIVEFLKALSGKYPVVEPPKLP